MTTDLYSILPGLQPSSQEILEAELLATQILSAQYPDMDLRAGTGLRDLVVRPNATLLALIKKGLEYIFAQNSLNSADDETPADMVDGILSNWFLERQLGTKSIINARLYFARQKNTAINSSVYFSTDNVSKFYPVEAASYSAASMVYDSYNNEYYLDVDLIAEKEGATYNLGAGSLLYFTNFDPYFLRAEINFLKEASIPSETNSKFIKRAETAISTRNLINVPSIDANLKAAFNYVTRLISVGMGDAEMVRDQIRAVFEDQIPRPLGSLISAGTLATATLAQHGYKNGQKVVISGATPAGYNGAYSVTVLDLSTFTFTLASPQTPISILPAVTAVNDPILIHDGGKVDIYCSDSLATAIVQLTLDKFGQAPVTGPVYSMSRSVISGGTENDTVPANVPFTVVNKNTQIKTVESAVPSTDEVLVTIHNHGYTENRYVTLQGCVPVSYNGTWLITDIVSEHQFKIKVVGLLASFTGGYAQFVIPDRDYGFSQEQSLIVDFGPGYSEKTVSLQLNYFQYLDSIQSYLNSSANRVVCADYLARGFNFYHLNVEITSYNAVTPDSASVTAVITNYLQNLAPGAMCVVSDMMTQLRLNGIVNIKNPPVITYKKYTRDLTPVKTGSIKDILDPNDRTNVFLLESVTTKSEVLTPNTLIIN